MDGEKCMPSSRLEEVGRLSERFGAGGWETVWATAPQHEKTDAGVCLG